MNLSTRKSLTCSLLLGAASAALACGSAFAQGTVEAPVETVVVTGSLIQQNAGEQPIPTIIIDADTIAKTGKANIGAVLSQLPQVTNSGADLTPVSSNFLTSGFGVSQVDLRNLGADRTLVLVNGRRWVSGSPTTTAIDLNTIPTQLIDHVDTITGGASATYGSDAIAGVVNITLKQDFEGVNATVQYGSSSRGDAGDLYASALVGGNFLDGKANVAIVMSYDNSQKVLSGDRDITSTDTFWGPGAFEAINTYSSYVPKGRFRYANPADVTGAILATGSAFTSEPDGTYGVFRTAADGYKRNPNRYIQVPVIRRVLSEIGHVDVTPWLRFFFEGTYAYTSAQSNLEPYPGGSDDGLSKPVSAGGTPILIPLGLDPLGPPRNPFIPAAFDAAAGAPPAGSPGLYFYRRFFDLGSRASRVDRDMGRAAVGFEGDFGSLKNNVGFLSDWKWNLSYVWGRTAESQFSRGYYDKIKMQNALNARAPTQAEIDAGLVPVGGGGNICNDAIAQAAGCVPINLFGANSITPEAAKYVGSLVTLQSHAVQQVATFNMNGSLFQLPAGAMKVAIGAEYRNESAAFVPDSASQAGTVAGNQQPETAGAFDVKEVYGEGLLPVLKDLPFAQYVELNGSVRFAKYSTAGTATSWKYGATWQVSDDLKFRGVEASATRAPNISELFAPNAQTFPGISADVCTSPSSPNAIANCAAQTAPIVPPGGIATPTYGGSTGLAAKQGVGGYTSGNPNLKPETAYTLTAGLVYTPSWLPGFQLTSDFYDIRVHGYINSLGPQETQQACYEGNPADIASNVFCQQIIRQYDTALGPIIKQINFPFFNLGSIKTGGVDTTMNYNFDLADFDPSLANAGSFALTLNTTYTSHFDQDAGIPGVSVLHFGGDTNVAPMWRGLFRSTYTNGPLEVSTTLHYIGRGYVSKEAALSPPGNTTDLNGNRLNSFWYMDLNVSYDITENVQAYVGANNVFDTRPPETYPGTPFEDTGTGTFATVYDPIGTFIYGGVNLKL